MRRRSTTMLVSTALATMALGPTACTTPPDTGQEITDIAQSQISSACVTLRRGDAGDVLDTFLSGDYPSSANGAGQNLYLGGSSAGNDNLALYGFDLGPIPEDSVVTQATFNVYISWNEDNGQIKARRLLAPWSEATATTASFDALANADPTVVSSFPGSGVGWKTADLTGLVGSWVSGAVPNHGIVLSEAHEHHHHSYSSESSPSVRPYLVVCYDGPTCSDNLQNQDETGVDCGGPCASCETCTDNLQNQGEGGIDCGGPCAPCLTCTDGLQNQDETGVDCGGPCGPCDSDGDGVLDDEDNCPDDANPVQTDCDGDGTGNACDADFEAADQASRSWIMSKRIGGATETYSIGTTAAGDDTVVAGYFARHAVIGGTALQTTSTTDFDIFVARLDDSGSAVWAKRFGDATSQTGSFQTDPRDGRHAVQVDSQGHVIVAGGFLGTVDFGGGPLVSPNGGTDIFVVAFDASGNHLWSKSFGGTGGNGRVRSVAVDGNDDLVITGGLTGTIDFGGSALVQPAAPGGNDESGAFVVKLDTNGNPLWSRRYGNATGQTVGNDVAVDGDGNVVLAGYLGGTVDVGNGPLTAQGSRDALVAKLDPDGNALWSKRFGNAADSNGDRAAAVAINAAGQVHVTGIVDGDVDFGGGVLAMGPAGGAYLVKLGPDGAHLESRVYGTGSSGPTFGAGVAVAPDQSAHVLMWGTPPSVDLGGGALAGSGSLHSWVARYAPNGAHLWSRVLSSGGNVFAQSLALDCAGHLLISGWYNGQLDLGGHVHSDFNANTVFVTKLAPVVDVDSDGDQTIDDEDTCPAMANANQLDQDTDGQGDVCDATPTGDGTGAHVWSGSYTGVVGDATSDAAGNTLLAGPLGSGPLALTSVSPTGSQTLATTYGTGYTGVARGVAVGGDGTIFLAGTASGSTAVDFGGGALAAGGGADAVLLAVYPNGAHKWSKRWGDAANQDTYDVAADPFGDVLVTGILRGTTSFGAGPLTSAGSEDVFVAKVSRTGSLQWAKRFGGAGTDYGTQVAVDSSGNVVIAGPMFGAVDFGGGPLGTAGVASSYLVTLGFNGSYLSGAHFPGVTISGLAIDSLGHRLVAGTFENAVTVSGSQLSTDEKSAVFVTKLTAAGAVVYSHAYTVDWLPTVRLAVDVNGNAILAGSFWGTLDIGGVSLVSPATQPDAWAAKLSPAGQLVYAHRYGGTGTQAFNAVAVNAAGQAVLAGNIGSSIDFGGGAFVPTGISVVKLAP